MKKNIIKKLVEFLSYKKITNGIIDIHDISNIFYYPIHNENLRSIIEGEGGVQKIEDYLEKKIYIFWKKYQSIGGL